MTDAYVRPDVQMILTMMAQSDQPLMSDVEPAVAREMYNMMGAMLEADAVDLARIEDIACPGPAGDIALRLYDSQAERSAETPVIMFYHGGGFVIGDLESHHSFCTYIARETGIPVVAVDYRMAPEAPFPAAPQDSLAATRWVADNQAQLKLKISGLIPCGDSAGGNLALVVGQIFATEPASVPVIAQFPIYPATRMDAEGGSMDEFAEGFLLTKASMEYFDSHYAPNDDDIHVSPYLGDLAKSPPTVLITAGLDPLRDQGRDYAADLIRHGVNTHFIEMAGNVHGFINLRKAVPSAQQDVDKMITAWKTLLASLES
ncbi:alpha/beta hydrolase [uncultured Parasphingorhabdus sp.]|uniref:alpha/beta hydrolase n=1 Tax=uncultured Parasphingorhabdus sp. TaxID=2709694 RepID=UPI0030DC7BD3|tara:strand:- start:27376 stop:28326 length:951 start_codon:yes stop_codon:yes gene_type:complete